jgi:pyruvate,water dikinase
VLGTIARRTVSDKAFEYRLTDHHTVERAPVEGDRRTAPSLSDEEVCAVARLARRAEKHYGNPQDVEWALDGDLEPGGNVVLLQARPETVWSRREPTPAATPATDFMASIVSTLLSPLHARPTQEQPP